MSEYIVDGRNIIIARQGKTPHWTEVVRCRDCKYCEVQTVCYSSNPYFVCLADWCEGADHDNPIVESDGFCAWGERRWLTCKCGEELESEGKCPSCGRWVS